MSYICLPLQEIRSYHSSAGQWDRRQYMTYSVEFNFTFNAYDVTYIPADEFNWYLPEWASFDGRNVRSNVKFEQLFSIILCFMDVGFGQRSAVAYQSCYFIISLMIPTIPTTTSTSILLNKLILCISMNGTYV